MPAKKCICTALLIYISDLQEQEKADRLNSALEGTVLAVLCISLWLVLRRRRTLRAAATASPSEAGPPAGGAAAEQQLAESAPTAQGPAEGGPTAVEQPREGDAAGSSPTQGRPHQQEAGSRPASRLCSGSVQRPDVRHMATQTEAPARAPRAASSILQSTGPDGPKAHGVRANSEAVRWHDNMTAETPLDEQQASEPLCSHGWDSLDTEALLAALEQQQHALLGKQLCAGQSRSRQADPWQGQWCSAAEQAGLNPMYVQ